MAGRSTGTAGHGADEKEAFAGSDPGSMGTAVAGGDQGAVAGQDAGSAGHGVEEAPDPTDATAMASDITRGSSAVMPQP